VKRTRAIVLLGGLLLLGGAASSPVQARPASKIVSAPSSPTHLTSRAFRTYIWPRARKGKRFLGYLRVGQRVALRSAKPVPGAGCRRGFYAIEPRGYVCHDRTVTFAEDSAFLRANAHTDPREGPFPYEYAISNGTPMYRRVPTRAEQHRYEWRFGKAGTHRRLPMFQRGHEHLAVSDPIAVTGPMPAFLRNGGGARGKPLSLLRQNIPHGAMMSFTRAFDVAGRTFLLSTDLTVVPANRVRRFRRSAFQGVRIGGEVRLPVAWIRQKPRPVYARDKGGRIVAEGSSYPVRSFVMITEEKIVQDGVTYLRVKTSESAPERFIAQRHATVVRARKKRPRGVRPGEKWILARLTQGTLTAYEDLTPVFVTLMSPGQGGVPRSGGDLVRDSTTPLGAYRITFKDRATMMAPLSKPRKFWADNVPFTQYFRAPFAIHGAYWHEKFGELASAGCINVSPIDAAHLFSWTDPPVPDGWQGVAGAGAPQNGPASMVVVER